MNEVLRFEGPLAELIEAGKALANSGLVQAKAGNLSVRIRNRIWVTRTGTDLGRLNFHSLTHAILEPTDSLATIKPPPGATSEFLLHYGVYIANPQVRSVIHTHPPYLVALSLSYSEGEFISPLDTEAPFYFEDLPVIEAPPGSVELAEKVADALLEHPAVLAKAHGLFAAAPCVAKALDITFAAEHCARIRLLAGKPR